MAFDKAEASVLDPKNFPSHRYFVEIGYSKAFYATCHDHDALHFVLPTVSARRNVKPVAKQTC
jgi:hypothetical protein